MEKTDYYDDALNDYIMGRNDLLIYRKHKHIYLYLTNHAHFIFKSMIIQRKMLATDK